MGEGPPPYEPDPDQGLLPVKEFFFATVACWESNLETVFDSNRCYINKDGLN